MGEGGWFGLSVALHVILIGLWAAFAKTKSLTSSAEKLRAATGSIPTGKALEEAVARFEERQEERMKEKVEDLRDIRDQLKALGGKSQGKPDAKLDELSLPEMYAEALAAERRITENYRDVRAAELAKIQNLSIEEARKRIDVPQPGRFKPRWDSFKDRVQDPIGLEKLKLEMAQAFRETDAMLGLGLNLLELARASAGTGMRGTDFAWAGSGDTGFAGEEALARARNDGSGPKDLSGYGVGPEGRDNRKAGGADEKAVLPFQEIRGDIKPLPGRRFSGSRLSSEWTFVDTWYTIGPFPNANRENLNRKFPPETVVDLDGTYEGKGGRTVRWTWQKSSGPMVVPAFDEEYGIYYATTEVYFDRARDVWMAVGSDDKSHVWVNGLLVWVSSDELKGWTIGEGYRKVHFRKGFNRVLYRVENGHHVVAFSMVLRLGG